MKAMILAAGFGTRLKPFSSHTPKPLFTIQNRPLLDIIIHQLHEAGCEAVMINCHHLGGAIADFIDRQKYPLTVKTVFEPEICGSGGGIKNVADFWDQQSFMVVNGDILFDFDLKKIYAFHLSHAHPVTMVLCDDPRFNTVDVSKDNFVAAFQSPAAKSPQKTPKRLTFSGIHVIDPEILARIPKDWFVNIIDVYRQLLADGQRIKAYIDKNSAWDDIGSPQRYHQAVYARMAPAAFEAAFGSKETLNIQKELLKGDGSDRRWYRLKNGSQSLVMVQHGIRPSRSVCEADAFWAIGTHLYQKGLPVPCIHLADPFAGLVFMQDLGDTHLQSLVAHMKRDDEIIACYRKVIDAAFAMWRAGADGFDPGWAYQGAAYDEALIMEKECRYFTDAFLTGFLDLSVDFEYLRAEFSDLSQKAVQYGLPGFMHRDLQSRNIMIHQGRPFFIDFQGARLGPLQYDLASLLIDPYVNLAPPIQDSLVDYCQGLLKKEDDQKKFGPGYAYCRITRNLQMLGAFGFLSKVKNKPFFKTFIPIGLATLKANMAILENEFPKLSKLVQKVVLKLET